jgi:hypothetical protein
MDFTGIGKISAFTKQKNLIYAANFKIKTGQSIVDSGGNLTLSKSTMFNSVQYSKTNKTSATEKARLESIKNKLKSGKKLSASEMNYLREKDEKLYKKAKYADEAREELKAELRGAKTKQEARQAVMRATAKIAADCSADFNAIQGGGEINFGGNMNVGGDYAISMNNGGENFNVEGGENFSSGEFSNSETVANENPFTQFLNANENSDSAFDILDKYLYAIRAIQDEWLEFMKTDEYKEMPEDIFDETEMQMRGELKPKISGLSLITALVAYKKSITYGLEK